VPAVASVGTGLDGSYGSDVGPLLIIAGAGTGKTNTLAHRVACLVESGVDPSTILLLLNAVDGCIPSDLATVSTAELEEERRLLYVAMTRAKDHLTLVVPQRFYVHQQGAGGDRHVYASRTRFIPDLLAAWFERGSWPVAANEAAPGARPQPAVDLAARLRGMWT
jgi:superfamily I DNA/RNA helicase